jgi:hypothetical protein
MKKIIMVKVGYFCMGKHYLSQKTNRILHSYDILSAGMLWKPKEARILKNFIDQPVNIR